MEEPTFELTTGSIFVASTPDSAAIRLDGRDTGLVTPDSLTLLVPGDHVVRVLRTDYAATVDSLTVTVAAGDCRTAGFTLIPTIGGLQVDSTPAGANVFLDGTDTGRITPTLLTRLPLGDHVVRAVLAGHLATPDSVVVTVRPDTLATAAFTFTPIPGSLAVTSSPSGATVFLDGADTGEITPATIDGLAVGSHTVAVARDGYTADPSSLAVEIVADEVAEAHFTLTRITGGLTVTSSPSGAAVLLDSIDTGEVTPVTLQELAPGDHTVAVELEGYAPLQGPAAVTITAGETAAIDLGLLPTAKIALLEGFSNVCCPGCPEMNAALHEFLALPARGPDRVLLIKWAVAYPSPADPHYLANPADNDARAWGPDYDMSGYYADLFVSVPTLFGDGALLGGSGDPPSVEELGPLVDALRTGAPGFGIGVAAAIDGAVVPVTITLAAATTVDLDGLTLNAVLVENPIVYDEAPCDGKDELEFHWVMRDHFVVSGALASPAVGAPVVVTTTLARNAAWPADRLFVIAFVQDDATREVVQAGSDIPAAPSARTALSHILSPPLPLNPTEAR